MRRDGFFVPLELAHALQEYLLGRPYREVADLLAALAQTKACKEPR